MGPCTFQEIARSFGLQLPDCPASRSLPFERFAHALITEGEPSFRDAAAATRPPPPSAVTATIVASSRSLLHLKHVFTLTPSVVGAVRGSCGARRAKGLVRLSVRFCYGFVTESVKTPAPLRRETRTL